LVKNADPLNIMLKKEYCLARTWGFPARITGETKLDGGCQKMSNSLLSNIFMLTKSIAGATFKPFMHHAPGETKLTGGSQEVKLRLFLLLLL